jgi:hypothetical protein
MNKSKNNEKKTKQKNNASNAEIGNTNTHEVTQNKKTEKLCLHKL